MFEKGDRVRNTMGQPATVTTVLTAGETIGVQYDGSDHTVYRPATLFTRIRNAKKTQTDKPAAA